MEPPPNNKVPPDRARDNTLVIEASPSTMTAVAVSQPSVNNQLVLYSDRPAAASSFTSISSAASTISMPSNTASSSSSVSAPIEKLSRPMAFDKVRAFSCTIKNPPVLHSYSLNEPIHALKFV